MHCSTKKQKIFLAPMEDITDFSFRQTLLKIGRPEVFFTEFVNVDGLVSKRGRFHVFHRLEKSKQEHPVILQLWGNSAEKFVKAAKLVEKLGFDGININMGCSVRKVVKVGCGAGLIGRNDVVERIVKDLQDLNLSSPLSIKTRLGFNEVDLESWISFLLSLNLETIFLHGRTAKQLFSGEADWDLIKKVVEMRDSLSPNTKLVGNGDVRSVSQAKKYMKKYGVDGVMIGREVLKNPWVFSERIPEKKERLETLLFHMQEMEKFTKKFPDKGWQSVKKFYYAYLREDEDLVSLRNELFRITSLEESISFLSCNKGME
jgi:tRNA-dihydrouridine synthase